MDAHRRTRGCCRGKGVRGPGQSRGSQQICVPMERELYDQIWHDHARVRQWLESLIAASPELFPVGIADGFQLHGRLSVSKKLGVRLRQVRLKEGRVFSLRPSFVTAYMTGTVADLEHPLLLLSVGTPCWVVTHIFGHNDMYWQRQLERLGRNSLVGTTVRDPARLPQDLVADEHHADWCGEKGYVAVTAGGGCFLGVALTESADDSHLEQAYADFQREAHEVSPEYAPRTVNTDGWAATQNAFRALFSTITVVLCFLHGFLKIRDRCRKARDLHARVWEVYHAATAAEFSTRFAALRDWWSNGSWTAPVLSTLEKLWNRRDEYLTSYSHPGCHRTSNLVDRLMNRLRRRLYSGRGLHGNQASSERRLRGLALLENFRPFAPRSNHHREYQSPAHRLSRKQYHPHWLHNLQASASLNGFRGCT